MVADGWSEQACLEKTSRTLHFRHGIVPASLCASGRNEPFGMAGGHVRERIRVRHALFVGSEVTESLERTSCEGGSGGAVACCLADSWKFRHLPVESRFRQGAAVYVEGKLPCRGGETSVRAWSW